MQVAARFLAVLCILVAQFDVLAEQLKNDGLQDLESFFEIVKWQTVGQFAATLVAPPGFRFIATALASFTAFAIGIALLIAWTTVVFPILAIIAWSNGEPSFIIGLMGLTIYVALSALTVRVVMEIDEGF